MAIKTIQTTSTNSSVIGSFEGECADANITNENGLDITREVWENVFNSELYKQALALGWYIGFLGHPEDPNCMDFRNACIVMRECHIDPNGKVYGKFDLLDTPVGRIVKVFIDAGVTFGISVRGVGDIVDNSVDPETFVFRGFDLVSFPAFPESIPEFHQVAASSDAAKQKKYKAICAAVSKNVHEITDVAAINTIQKQFAKQSDEYRELESRKAELLGSANASAEVIEDAETIDVMQEKVSAMTQLYLDKSAECDAAISANLKLKKSLSTKSGEYARKFRAMKRITSAQMDDKSRSERRVVASNMTLSAANKRLKSEIDSIKKVNLEYKQKINANEEIIRRQTSDISSLSKKLRETVTAASKTEARTSNLDDEMNRLRSENSKLRKLLCSYQAEYAQMYANAIGVDLGHVNITATTTVADLQSAISGTIMSSVPDSEFDTDLEISDVGDDGLVTI